MVGIEGSGSGTGVGKSVFIFFLTNGCFLGPFPVLRFMRRLFLAVLLVPWCTSSIFSFLAAFFFLANCSHVFFEEKHLVSNNIWHKKMVVTREKASSVATRFQDLDCNSSAYEEGRFI